jgi:hypothetical protein
MEIKISMLLASKHENLCRLARSLNISTEGCEHDELAWFVMNEILEDRIRHDRENAMKAFLQ